MNREIKNCRLPSKIQNPKKPIEFVKFPKTNQIKPNLNLHQNKFAQLKSYQPILNMPNIAIKFKANKST